jgi:hypothetical protein
MDINDRGVWLTKTMTDSHVHDKSLSDALVFKYKEFNTVVDIGCGSGKYVKNFNDHGVICMGYDGSPLTPEIANEYCHVMDFSEDQDIGKYDIVLSLETGEHIPRQYEEVFIDNVCRASSKKVIMSWAVEGQGGNGHYNERGNDYVIHEMNKRGFDFNHDESVFLRKESCAPWFKNTIMVFDKVREAVSAIFFSCRRLELLKETVVSFLASNTYPMREIIIVNDSGDTAIHEQLKRMYPNFTLVLHPENVGLIKSIDLGYAHIKTDYFFHDEDDWAFNGKEGFMEKSVEIMQHRPDIEEVWLADYNAHPVEPEVLKAGNTEYRLVGDSGPWHGFTTACGLKRISDYKKVAPYADIPWEKTIWHRECIIGQQYFKLGYRTAILMEEYVHNIGLGKSEYVTGLEK